jgi:hypothetical protein
MCCHLSHEPGCYCSCIIHVEFISLSYGPPWVHYLGGYQDRLPGGPLGLPGLSYMASDGVERTYYKGIVLG